MNEVKKNIIISFIFVLSLVCVVAYSSFSFVSEKRREYDDTLSVVPEKIEKLSNDKTYIEKTETKDYYFYSVEDYERDLSYSWKFMKEENKDISVEESLYIEEDLRLSLDANTKDANIINDKVEQEKLIISFDYHGALPLETTVKINVADRFNNGEKLYLYYYNPENDTIEYIMHNVEVKNGFIEFQIEHCSDYFLTAAVVNDAIDNPQSVNLIIIGLIVIVFILIAVTLLQSKK